MDDDRIGVGDGPAKRRRAGSFAAPMAAACENIDRMNDDGSSSWSIEWAPIGLTAADTPVAG